MNQIDEILNKYFPEKCFGTIGYCMCAEQKREAKAKLKEVVMKYLPLDMDDRKEISEWLVSEDYTKGYNQALDNVRQSLSEIFGEV